MSTREATQNCRHCGGVTRTSRFDVTLGGPEPQDERLFFGMAGEVCLACRSIDLDRDTQLVLGVTPRLPWSAIESDVVLARGWSAPDR
jgi:hypothetical protein